MKRLLLLTAVVLLAASIRQTVQAQRTAVSSTSSSGVPTRCWTMESMYAEFAKDPAAKTRLQANEELLNQRSVLKIQQRMSRTTSTSGAQEKLTSNVIIPVVVHIVLPDPTIITDADVEAQIAKLNEDYAGKNADSTKAGVFDSLFGHSYLQFTLAKRDPQGNPTNGIERVASSELFSGTTSSTIKHSSSNGSDQWDDTRYYNVWVGHSSGSQILGIATFPDDGADNEQGVMIDYVAFGNNTNYVNSAYNLGRTLVHETGHYFFARHIWGDDNSCGTDFPSVSGLPTYVDDTPPQSTYTTGCPSGTQATGCSAGPNPPGKMYQNYMDYTNDECYCMFTLNQVARMESALEIFRPTLMTSDGGEEAVRYSLDGSIAQFVSPSILNTATGLANNVACDSTLHPIVTFKNWGTTTLTSAVIAAQIDSGTPVLYTWTGSLPKDSSVNVTLNAIESPRGNHTLTTYVKSVNNSADLRLSNDTLSTTYDVVVIKDTNIQEGFETTTYPPSGWSINNPDGDVTWARTGTAAKTGKYSVYIDSYDYTSSSSSVKADLLRLPTLNGANADSITLSFDVANASYDGNSIDTLEVLVSTNCGVTYTSVYKKYGSTLTTAGKYVTDAFVPTSAQWRTDKVDLNAYKGQQIVVAFRYKSNYSNNTYLDNINLSEVKLVSLDAAAYSITSPARRICSGDSFTPSFVLKNTGFTTLTSVQAQYHVDDNTAKAYNWTGSLATGDTTTITLPEATATEGNHTYTVIVVNPNGGSDQKESNDTAVASFIISTSPATAIQEGFEGATFAPTQWDVNNVNADAVAWQRTTNAAFSGTASVYLHNFATTTTNLTDWLTTPVLKISGSDSTFLTFQLAAAGRTTTDQDTLEVLISGDCGQNWQSAYKRWGTSLVTTSTAYTANFVPLTTDLWRKDSIYITPFASGATDILAAFRVTGNEGNNIYLDDINMYNVSISQNLKDHGVLVTPNPFSNKFAVRHYPTASGLQSMSVYNQIGQLVLARSFSTGTASSYFEVDMSGKAAGVYLVRLVYSSGKTVTIKTIKQND